VLYWIQQQLFNLLFGSRFQVIIRLRTKQVKQLQINHTAIMLEICTEI